MLLSAETLEPSRQVQKLNAFLLPCLRWYTILPGRTESPMPFWRGLGSPVCIPNWSKDACSGLAMYMYTVVYVDDDGCLANNCPRGRLQLHSRPSSSVWIAGRLRPQSVWSVETNSEDKQWRQTVKKGLSRFGTMPAKQSKEKRHRMKGQSQGGRPPSVFVYICYKKDCFYYIDLSSLTWNCATATIQRTSACQLVSKTDQCQLYTCLLDLKSI